MRLPDPQRSYAVLIGTSTYRSQELGDLPAVANNLTGLNEALTDPALGCLPSEHCVVLPDPSDMKVAYRILRHHAAVATDTLLVYFAGHGLLGGLHQTELYLALADTHRDELPVSALPFELIRRVFLDSPALNRVLILDCCFSGRASMPHMSDPEETVLGQIDIEGTYTLAAAGANDVALAPAGALYTAFTGALLTLLHTGVPGGPELLTFATIYRELLRALPSRGLPRPQQRNTGTADHLALTRNPAHGRSFEQSAQPIQDHAGDDTHDIAADCRGITEHEGRRWSVGGRRIGAAVGLGAAIGLLTAAGFLVPKLLGAVHDNVLDELVSYNFEQGINSDAQTNRYVTDVTGNGHLGYLKTSQDGGLTFIDHPGQGKAVHFPTPCTSTPPTTCPLALIQTAGSNDFNPGTRDFSYGADVLIKPAEARRHASIMQKGPVPDSGGQWKLQLEDTAGAPSCLISGKNSPHEIHRAVANVSVADGSWHKIQCVKTATALTINVDSVNGGHASLPSGLAIENGYPMSIGGLYANPVSNSNPFFGALDNVYFDLSRQAQ